MGRSGLVVGGGEVRGVQVAGGGREHGVQVSVVKAALGLAGHALWRVLGQQSS
ncbi:hypothetical protein I79_016341 [Cricetulus griseus]|uniref:Uncharacterized protein n=1 Tax=Cricetulus griseus TaxID=10029 RepID=G3HZ46_CRIGR|nr:hypothetical protein I79_016341 [Cricetulus griseus]